MKHLPLAVAFLLVNCSGGKQSTVQEIDLSFLDREIEDLKRRVTKPAVAKPAPASIAKVSEQVPATPPAKPPPPKETPREAGELTPEQRKALDKMLKANDI